MFVKHLQEFLSKFTEANKAGTRQGNAISNAKIYIEKDGRLHEIKRIEVQDQGIIGQPSIRVVIKTQEKQEIILPPSLMKEFLNECTSHPEKPMGPEAKLYQKLKETPMEFHGFGLKTLAYLVLLIYWGIIILGTFLL